MQPRKLPPRGFAALFVLLVLLMSFVGNLHYAAALTDEAIEKEKRPQRVAELYGRGFRPDLPQRLVLTSPTDCGEAKADATVTQRVYYISAGITRCYSRSTQ